jgi:hypothetical protein
MTTQGQSGEESDDYDDDGGFDCPKCGGWGFVDCHCGGDLCVCEYYGEAPCRVCHGDGKVTAEQYDKYERARAEAYRLYYRLYKEGLPPSPPTPPQRRGSK